MTVEEFFKKIYSELESEEEKGIWKNVYRKAIGFGILKKESEIKNGSISIMIGAVDGYISNRKFKEQKYKNILSKIQEISDPLLKQKTS